MKAYKKGYLKVDHHKLYYHAYGNPNGVPFLVLHGGPGYHSTTSSLKNFDLKKDFVILYDQRGCGKSTPFCDLRKNTIWHLIKDINVILDFFKISKVNLAGGSWGTTLALAYSINNPHRVSSMILRGIFLGREKDINAIYYPKKDWTESQKIKHQATLGQLEKKFKLKNFASDAFNVLKKNNKESIEFAKLWALYEDLLCSNDFRVPLEYSKEDIATIKAISLIETFYFKHNCFLPKNYIIKNSNKIKHIPVFIVHGAQDMVCPKYQAYDLLKALINVTFKLDPKGGHIMSTGNMTALFIRMVNRSRKMFLKSENLHMVKTI